jgi:hypothetical protein
LRHLTWRLDRNTARCAELFFWVLSVYGTVVISRSHFRTAEFTMGPRTIIVRSKI